MSNPKRPSISERNRLIVWAAAAGRCTFCNRIVFEDEDLGEAVPIGELAHNVGWSRNSPRGATAEDLDTSDPENLLLLCRNCHKPADDSGVTGRFTVERLQQFKREHEQRIRMLTDIGADRQAAVVRIVGAVRNVSPELTHDTVMEAVTAVGIFPQPLPGAFLNELDLDLRQLSGNDDTATFTAAAAEIDTLIARVHDGVRRGAIKRVAVFAFARIPLLVHLGARLDDKVETLVFQRQRIDTANAWRWPDAGVPATFEIRNNLQSDDKTNVAVTLSLSGTILPEELPVEIRETHTVLDVRPTDGSRPTVIDSPASLASLERTLRELLAQIERDHGKVASINVFAAVPLSAAITLGRVLMPNVSPALVVYDRDENNDFFAALEVKR